MFIEWMSKYNNEQYCIASVDGDGEIDMDSFSIRLVDEFIYNYCSDTSIDYYTGKLYGNKYITTYRDNDSHPTTKKANSNNVSFRMMKLPVKT